jgi:hypothetical protein
MEELEELGEGFVPKNTQSPVQYNIVSKINHTIAKIFLFSVVSVKIKVKPSSSSCSSSSSSSFLASSGPLISFHVCKRRYRAE